MVYKSFNSSIDPDMRREKMLSVDNKIAEQPKFFNRALGLWQTSKQKPSPPLFFCSFRE